MTRQLMFATIVCLSLGTGCNDSGFATFDGTVVGGPDCVADFLPFESEFQTAQEYESSVRLFFQSDGGVPSGKDVFTFVNPDPSSVTPGSTFELLPPISTGESGFSGQLLVEESCPEENVSFHLTGSITIDSYEATEGATIAGTLDGAEVIDTRSEEVVMTGVSGSWEFPYQTGPPYEPYP